MRPLTGQKKKVRAGHSSLLMGSGGSSPLNPPPMIGVYQSPVAAGTRSGSRGGVSQGGLGISHGWQEDSPEQGDQPPQRAPRAPQPAPYATFGDAPTSAAPSSRGYGGYGGPPMDAGEAPFSGGDLYSSVCTLPNTLQGLY